MATEQFHYPTADGEIVISHISKIKTGVLRKYRKLEEMDMVFSIIEEIADEDTLSRLDELDQGQLEDFVTKWQAGASVGESSRSST